MKRFFISRICLLLFCVTFSLHAMPNSRDSSIIKKRMDLITQSDSIDLLKQSFKRKGMALTELEEKQKAIHDTLKYLNNQIQKIKFSPTRTSIPDLIRSISLKPDTIFDWIIIVVGIIAIISGVFLVFGVFSIARSKKKRSKKKRPVQNSIPPPQKAPAPSTHPIDELRALATNTSDTVTQLRRQLKNSEHENNAPDRERLKQHQEPEEEMAPLPVSDNEYKRDTHTEKKIIEAARNGASPQEISKKFHTSIDQVSLILKVAGVKSKKTGR